MNGSRSSSHLTGREFTRGKPGLLHDSPPVLLGLAGFDGKLKFLGPAWETILGYPLQELLERPLWELLPHERSVAVGLVNRLLTGHSFDRLEFGLRCKDGTCRWFLWHRRFDSEHQAIFISGYDITEQKSREIASILRSYEQPRGSDPASPPVAR
jgi:PAS domain S-box-containing protein